MLDQDNFNLISILITCLQDNVWEKLHVNHFWELKGYLKGWGGCEKMLINSFFFCFFFFVALPIVFLNLMLSR